MFAPPDARTCESAALPARAASTSLTSGALVKKALPSSAGSDGALASAAPMVAAAATSRCDPDLRLAQRAQLRLLAKTRERFRAREAARAVALACAMAEPPEPNGVGLAKNRLDAMLPPAARALASTRPRPLAFAADSAPPPVVAQPPIPPRASDFAFTVETPPPVAEAVELAAPPAPP
jgi:hypothetical protein